MNQFMQECIHVTRITIPLLLQGVFVTIEISVLAIALAMVLGGVAGYFRISENRVLRGIAGIYIKIFRCTPFMVEVYLAYYGLPMLGIDVSAFWTGVLILGCYTSAYVAVILESGIRALSKGQSEAAYAMGMSKTKTLMRILLPQTISVIIPSLTGQFIQTVKDSSILSIITVAELTMMTKEAIGITFSPLIVYMCAGLFYWAINLVIEFTSKKIEKKNRRISV
ncbi:MAG: amino acid ABC transporter permease [Lachnospiraceae bacterium]|nr:amino acid ABC transporter permease [Lachnospiraceae bacterium]